MTESPAVLPNPQPLAPPQSPPGRVSAWGWPAYLLLFAFLLASFPARNTDVWANLASGRDLLGGRFAGLSFTWLYDLGLYLTHAVGGEFLAVALKAVAVGGVGVLLLFTGRTRSGWLVPVICAGLAALAVSSKAVLRPTTVSYLFLALVLWLETHPHGATARRFPWPTAVLFLLWANADRGFLFGLAVLTVMWVGQALDASGAATRPLLWRRLLFLGAFAAVGLLNPAHLSGFPLPVEFVGLLDGTTRTPFSADYFAGVRASPAGLAYYALVAFGLIGFALNPRGFRWERFLPWVLAGVLSGITDRAVPLFAVVGGPIAARNLSDYFAQAEAARPTRVPALVGTPLVVFGAVVFLIAAWPGLLFGPPYEPRRWAFDLPASPAAAADWVRQERQAGRWDGEKKTAHLIGRSVVPFRWFCPDDAAVADPSIPESLLRGLPVDDKMRAAGCARLLVHHPNREQLGDDEKAQLRQMLRVLLGDPHRWPLLHVGGDVAVFGWRDPQAKADPFAGRGLDLTATLVPEWEDTPLPLSGPSAAADWKGRVADWFRTPRRTQSLHRDQAAMLLLLAESSADSVTFRNGQAWIFEQAAALTASAALQVNPVSAVTDAAVRATYCYPPMPKDGPPPPITAAINQQFQGAMFAKDDLFAAPAYTAIRAGRRAVADNPTDPLAYLLLGEAYMLVRERTRERAWAEMFPKLAELRQAQAAAALHRALDLAPTPAFQVRVHRLLARLYANNEFTDLAAEQFRKSKVAYPGRPPAPREKDELDRAFEALEKDLQARTDAYDKDAVRKTVMEKVAIARNLHLSGKALELLLESDVSAFGANGMKIELELLVRTGRPNDVLDWTTAELKQAVGPQSYHWYRAMAMAARGDYAAADPELADIAGGVKATAPDQEFLAQSLAFMVAKNVLGEAPAAPGLPDAVRQTLSRAEAYEGFGEIELRLKNLAEVSVLRGVLAAEAGDLDRAREQFRAALTFSPEVQISGGKPAAVVAQGMLTRLEPVGKR